MKLCLASSRRMCAEKASGSTGRELCLRLGFLLVLLSYGMGLAVAQQPTGAIVGTVTDTTGAVMQGATVTITQNATRISRTLITNAAGQYAVPYLVDGDYTVKAEHQNFRVEVVDNVLLQAAQTVRIDIRMQVGNVSEVAEVSATAISLQTDSAAVGTTIQSQTVSQLPLNGRTFAQLATLVPGVAAQGSINIATQRERGSVGTAIAITSNGFSDVQNNFVYDGEPAMDLDSYDFAFAPSIDAIGEFRVQTNSYSAASGGAPGAQVDVITKAGTNTFHGTLWEFNRNNDYAARNYFSTARARLNRNQFGANLGGPILKNKAFFFFNWESGRQVQGTSGTLLSVPPAAFRTGDFSSLLPNTVIVDPATGQPFPNNKITNIDPNALVLLPFTPEANIPSNAMGGNNFLTSSVSTPTNENQYIGRVDYNLSPSNVLFARYMFDRLETPNEPPVFGNDENINTSWGQNQVIGWTHTFKPTFISNFLIGWNRFTEHQLFGTTGNSKFNIACGLMNLPYVACDPFNYGPPDIEAGYSMFAVRDNGPRDRLNQRYSLDQKNSVQIGRHLLDFGGSFYRLNWTFDEVVYPRGVYGFDGVQTTPAGAVPTAANQFADFLLGLAHSLTLSPTPFYILENSSNANLYAQDNWRVTSKLTINFGLRWDLFMRPHQKEQTIANYFMNNNGGLIASGRFDIPSRPQGWPIALVFNDYADWGPRFGAAWTPISGTVFRGGYGLYYSPEISNSYTNMGLNFPFIQYVNVVASETAPIAYDQLSAVAPLFTGAGALGAYGVDPHIRDSRAQEWNVTIEQQLPSKMFLNMGYVGTHGSRLTYEWDANRAVTPSLPGPPIVRPNPDYGAINMAGSIGTSDYNSLQLQLLRHVGTGLDVMGAYTWSKSLGDVDGGDFGSTYAANGIQDIFNLRAARSIQSFDIRHRMSASLQYAVPFFLNSKGLWRQVLGGWALNAIVTEQTGIGNGVGYGANTTNTGVGSQPDMVADPVLARGQRSVNEWFNTAAFVAPAPGRFGISPRLSYHNPGINNVDLMAGKTFFVREGVTAAFRAEFFNAFNHTNFEDVNNTFTSPGFGSVTDSLDPRIGQLGLKLNF
jgi:hypothetical protein